MSQDPYISVIIPVYNVEDYIAECLESVMHQTYTDFECIIVDDCGNDKSMQLCQEMIENYQGPIQFKILHHEHNRGLSAARNTGIKQALGEYIFFLDSDDYITHHCLESLVSLALKYPGVDIVQGLICYNEDLEYFDYSNKDFDEYYTDQEWIQKHFLNEIPPMAWNRLIRKKLIIDHSLYFAEGLLNEDEHWRLMSFSYIHSIALCFERTYYYRIRQGSIMNVMTSKSLELSYKRMLEHLISDNLLILNCHSEQYIYESIIKCFNSDENGLTDCQKKMFKVISSANNTPVNVRLFCYLVKYARRIKHRQQLFKICHPNIWWRNRKEFMLKHRQF